MLKAISDDVVILGNYIQGIKKELKEIRAERESLMEMVKEANEAKVELAVGDKVCFVEDQKRVGKVVRLSNHSAWIKIGKKEICKRRHKVEKVLD